MYHRLYTDAVEESYVSARRRERELLQRAVEKLAVAKARGARSPESFEATYFVRRLWTTFVLDLGNEENALPLPLRASLISIGLWIRQEVDLIDAGKSQNFDGLIEINQLIADGLM